MFDLKSPCDKCPFRKENGHSFRLNPTRLNHIINAVAFQCHKTTTKVQQCAGLMGILHLEKQHNAIMKFGMLFDCFNPEELDTSEVYQSIKEAVKAHTGGTSAKKNIRSKPKRQGS